MPKSDDKSTPEETAHDTSAPGAPDAPGAPGEPDEEIGAPGEPGATDSFDAIGAAAELDEILAGVGSAEPVEQHGESYTEILESEVATLNELVSAREAELSEAREELQRSRERVERESERQLEQRTRKMLLGFLEVLDNLDRALVAARGMDHNPTVIDGVELVRRNFMNKLVSFGVSHDPSMGEVFNPELHDAVSVTPTQDPQQDGKVIAVIHEGYLIGDEILRPAGVIVGKMSG